MSWPSLLEIRRSLAGYAEGHWSKTTLANSMRSTYLILLEKRFPELAYRQTGFLPASTGLSKNFATCASHLTFGGWLG